ncbi:MAG: hypothetical protein KF796_19520 [Ramlibacter sp.]|nr:hypothetical protein [Ramlibacter sp.]
MIHHVEADDVTYPSLSGYMVALTALVPKRGATVTTVALAAASKLTEARVRIELQPLVDAGSLAYDALRDTYSAPAQPEAAHG